MKKNKLGLTAIILAGGTGTRLGNLTSAYNKSLLPIADKPLICHITNFALQLCDKALIISTDCQLSNISRAIYHDQTIDEKIVYYNVQPIPLGIADAISYGRSFCNEGPVMVFLGDNIYNREDRDIIFNQCKQVAHRSKQHTLWSLIAGNVSNFGAHVWLYQHLHPENYGVIDLNGDKPVHIEEKPTNPRSDLIISGIYLFDNRVWQILPQLIPSMRGELEITDVLKYYLSNKALSCHKLNGKFNDIGESVDSYWSIANMYNREHIGDVND